MAASVVMWLAKRSGKGKAAAGGDGNVDLTDPTAKAQRNQREQTKVFHSPPEESLEDVAAKRIQSAYRGYLLRKEVDLFVLESNLSGAAIQTCVDLALDWYQGWLAQIIALLLLACFMITVGVQMFIDSPAVFDSDSSFLVRVTTAQMQSARENILQSTDLYAFMRTFVDNLHYPHLVASKECTDMLSVYCPFNANRLELEFENSTSRLIQSLADVCPKVSSSSGYIDSSRRVVGTVYVTQTRRSVIPCHDRMLKVDPYVGTSRECLSDSEEATEFLPTTACPSCSSQFEFRVTQQVYAHALAGSAFNLPIEFLQCRIDELEANQWLDYRTKQVCFLVTLLDMHNSGRLTAFSECFKFIPGGRVVNKREVASVSFLAAGTQPVLALTICSIILVLCRQLYMLARIKQEYKSISFWFRWAGTTLELTSNCMYLSFLSQMNAFEFSPPIDESGFFNDPFAYLDEFTTTFALSEFWREYTFVASFGLVFLLADAIAKMDFHPSTALVRGILRRSASGLGSFFFVLTVFVLVYSFIGMILFTSTFDRFSDYGSALNTVLLLAIGAYDEVEGAISNPSNKLRITAIQLVYFWVYVFLVSILLFNVLLAIIVGAFAQMHDYSTSAEPMFSLSRSFVESAWFVRVKIKVTFQRWFCSTAAMKRETPVEILLKLRMLYRINGASAIQLREELNLVFHSSQTTELFLIRCRQCTHRGKFQSRELFLKGLDANSDALKGHMLNLLESIDDRQKKMMATQLRFRGEWRKHGM